jgi:outer membrane scaffolding protein for murein synthesis (MipA/OmpV family)
MVSPKYEGSSDYDVMGFPFVAPASLGSDGRVQVQGPDDVRLRLFKHNGFEAGPLAGWRFGRDEDDSDRLWGLGDVDGGLVIGGYMAYQIGFLKPFLSYHHQVTGDDGGVLRFGTEAKTIFGPGIEVIGTLGASYADKSYMDSYFSIDAAQAASSVAGLQAYDAGAGVKDVYVGLTARFPIDERWTVRLSTRYAHLIGDAADSPVVENNSQFSAGLGLSYRLDLR